MEVVQRPHFNICKRNSFLTRLAPVIRHLVGLQVWYAPMRLYVKIVTLMENVRLYKILSDIKFKNTGLFPEKNL